MSRLEVTIQLNKDKRPDKAQVDRMFKLFIADMGIGISGGSVGNIGKTMFKIKANDVTGVDINTPVTVTFRPRDNFMRIQIFRDPDGPAGAAVVAGKLAERLAAAYHLQLGENTITSKRRADCIADIQAQGWNGEFQEILAEYTP
jgi:hypothetical protein